MIEAFFRFLPAYFANSAPLPAAKIKVFDFLDTPLDMGKKWRKKRIFGDGKTVRGLFTGVLIGTLSGVLISDFRLAFLLSLGALTGDAVGSFIKRRVGFKRGENAGLLDRVDFVIGALLFAFPYFRHSEILFLILITPPLHRVGNFIGYILKLKKVPW